jgi:hypothetical protein
MKTFRCACEARIFFRNSSCLSCSRDLGFVPEHGLMSAIEPLRGGTFKALAVGEKYRKCKNFAEEKVCNWLVHERDAEELCRSCRLTRVVPDKGEPANLERWSRIEGAKRHLLYTLIALGLPIEPRDEERGSGLAFEFKAPAPDQPVSTGHADGVITLNLEEADPVAREEMRVKMKERYRTLLGHFRHEIGHYYWQRLVEPDEALLARCRELFGDDRDDYAEALKRHYARDSGAAWQDEFITEYASAHPWEDWAESWAHYMHMIDTFETAQHFGLTHAEERVSLSGGRAPFEVVLGNWMELTLALNQLNRSMGLADPYPFAIGVKAGEKLAFVHDVIASAAEKRGSLERLDVDRHAQAV